MGVGYNPKIVTDGLVLCLDAANKKSYPGSGTTWTDLSGKNNNGILTDGPTFNTTNKGSFTFDGIDDFVQCETSINVTSASFIAWIKRNGNQADYSGIVISVYTAVAAGINFREANDLGYHWGTTSEPYLFVSGLSIPDLEWCMCAATISPSEANLYVGTSSGIDSSTHTFSHNSTALEDIQIGQYDYFGERFYKGNIAVTQVYNRALSTAEIQQNFNALRGRFGI